MKWCSTYLYRSIQKRRAKDMIRMIESEAHENAVYKAIYDDILYIKEVELSGEALTPAEHLRLYRSEIKH